MNFSFSKENEGERMIYEGVGSKAYIFEKYSSDSLVFADESNIIRIFHYDDHTRSVIPTNLLSGSIDYKEVFAFQLGFESVAMTDKTILLQDKAYCLYPAENRIEFYPKRPEVIEMPLGDVAGPLVNYKMQRIMTVSKSKNGQGNELQVFPFLDQHSIPIIEDMWASSESVPIRYIVNHNGDIMYKIEGKFFMFRKNGAFICEVEIEDSDDLSTIEHKALSPNGKFLVYEIRSASLIEIRKNGPPAQIKSPSRV